MRSDLTKLQQQPLLIGPVVLVAVWVLYYCGMRIAEQPFTHDEAYSFNHYVGKSVWGIITYEAPYLPNNHILNTLLMKLSGAIFGPEEWALRLPNGLALANYLFFSVLLAIRTLPKAAVFPAFIALAANPYLLDFFSLARGYGLSISLMVAGIYFLVIAIGEDRRRPMWWSLSFLALAVLANFTVLSVYLAVAGIWFLHALFPPALKPETHRWKAFGINMIPVWVVTLVLGLVLYLPFTRMQGQTFGGESGFWSNCFQSMVFRSGYNRFGHLGDLWEWIFKGILVVYFVLLVYQGIRQGWTNIPRVTIAIGLLFIFPMVIVTLQFYLLGQHFVENRTALYFYPLIILVIFFLFGRLIPKAKVFGTILLTAFAIILSLNTLTAVSHQQALDWDYEAHTDDIFNQLELQSLDKELAVGINWLFEPTLNYYRTKYKVTNIKPFTRDDWKAKPYDLYVLFFKDTAENLHLVANWEVVKSYPDIEVAIWKPKPAKDPAE